MVNARPFASRIPQPCTEARRTPSGLVASIAGSAGYVLLWALKYADLHLSIGAIAALLAGLLVLGLWAHYVNRHVLNPLDPLAYHHRRAVVGFCCSLLYLPQDLAPIRGADGYDLFMAVLATLAFLVGYTIPLGHHLAKVFPVPTLLHSRIRSDARTWLAILWLAITVFLLAYSVPRGYGTPALRVRASRSSFSNLIMSIGGFAQYPLYFVILLTVSTRRRRGPWMLLLLGLLAAEGAVLSRMGWKVGPLVFVLGLLCAIRGQGWTRRERLYAVALLAAVLLSFPWFFVVVNYHRRATRDRPPTLHQFLDTATRTEADPNAVRQLAERIAYGTMFARVVHAVDSGVIEPQRGATIWPAFVAFIPRCVWPEKPVMSIGGWYATTVLGWAPGGGEAGVTLPGDFYMNFGIVGVIIGCLSMVWFSEAFTSTSVPVGPHSRHSCS